MHYSSSILAALWSAIVLLQPSHAATLGPFTFDQAISACASANAGDLILVKAGTYSASRKNIKCTKGQAGNPITIRAETKDSVTFSGDISIVMNGNWLTLDGFRFIKASASGAAVEMEGTGLRFTNCQ